MSPSIVCICGFSVTRERAEQLLLGQPEGTFLLRPSLSMDSTIVISVARSARVYHLAVDAQQLETRTIEVRLPSDLLLPPLLPVFPYAEGVELYSMILGPFGGVLKRGKK